MTLPKIPELDSFRLKTIAAASMLVDHTAAAFPETFPLWFRAIGRLAWPLFAFLLAESFRHTKNTQALLFRLFAFGIISQVPYNLALMGTSMDRAFTQAYGLNIFFTLTLGGALAAAYAHMEKIRTGRCDRHGPENASTIRKNFTALTDNILFVSFAGTILLIFVHGTGIAFDYGVLGIMSIPILYMLPGKKSKLAFMAFFALMQFGPSFTYLLESSIADRQPRAMSREAINLLPVMALMALATVPIAAFHNGKRGRETKWSFYIFYPAHLTALALIRIIF